MCVLLNPCFFVYLMKEGLVEMNEILLFVEIAIMFGLLILAKKFFGKIGLFVWIGIASILANIQVTKSINILGLSGTLGNVMFASNFLATDILSECYGKKEAKKGVYIGVFSIIVYLICTQLSLLFLPNDIDIAQGSMNTLFALAPRICISSLLMFFLANLADVYVFETLKKKFDGKKLWLRNNISTILCNCLENFGFVFLAFLGVYSIQDVLGIAISTSIIEIIIALCDTPFVYLAKNVKDLPENE